jgi:hypothetical protein
LSAMDWAWFRDIATAVLLVALLLLDALEC